MAEVIEVVRRFRAALGRQDTRVQRMLLREYADLQRTMRAEADSLQARMQAAVDRGEPIRPSWLHTEGRLDQLQRQLEAEVESYARRVAPVVQRADAEAVRLGARAGAQGLVAGGLDVGAATLRPDVLETLVARTATRAPVGQVLADMAPQASQQLRAQLLRGAALGENPMRVASRMRQVADVPLARARTVARTEQLRAFRSANVATFQAAPAGALAGWVWVAADDACPACLAEHGQLFDVAEDMESHPNCRCVPAPQSAASPAVATPHSAERLAGQVPPALGALLRSGRIARADLVARRYSPVWGTTRTAASVPRALANAQARRARAMA